MDNTKQIVVAGGFALIISLSATLASAGTTNAPGFTDDFESYTTPNQTIIGLAGWDAPDVDAATAYVTNYSGVTQAGWPSAHTIVMKLDGSVTNATESGPGVATYTDMILKPTFWTDETDPTVSDTQIAAFYISTNNQLVLRSYILDQVTPANSSNRWTHLVHPAIESNDWIRVTIWTTNATDGYLSSSKNWFQIYLNGTLLTHSDSPTFVDFNSNWVDPGPTGTDGPWFSTPESQTSNTLYTISGTGFLDDFSFDTATPFSGITYHYITTVAGPGGEISPTSLNVEEGTDQGFTITGALYYSLVDVTTNGGTIGPVSAFTFTNVLSPQTISATFVADTAADGTPHYWLAAHGYDGTPSWDINESSDDDGDGLSAGNEWIGGTDPTNVMSVFRIIETGKVNGTNYMVWLGGDTNRPPFDVYRSEIAPTNFTLVANVTRSADGTNTWIESSQPAGEAFYKVIAK